VTKSFVTNWNCDAASGITHWGATAQTVGWLHTYRTHAAVSKLLCNFSQNYVWLAVNSDSELKRLVKFWQRPARKLNVDNRTSNGDYSPIFAVCVCCCAHFFSLLISLKTS
jgi:hypothetical protein